MLVCVCYFHAWSNALSTSAATCLSDKTLWTKWRHHPASYLMSLFYLTSDAWSVIYKETIEREMWKEKLCYQPYFDTVAIAFVDVDNNTYLTQADYASMQEQVYSSNRLNLYCWFSVVLQYIGSRVQKGMPEKNIDIYKMHYKHTKC